MAASRDLPFPLVIVCLLFIRGRFSLPTAGTNPTRPLRPLPSTDDYDLEDEPTSMTPIRASPPSTSERCRYSPCLEGQTPCAVLASRTGCLCRGSTPHNVVPEAPALKSVSWNGSEVVVQWCAPYSYVTTYSVTVGGQERKTFGGDRRSGALGDIDHAAEVCVAAANERGASGTSCAMYHPRDDSLALKAGLIGGALGLLLLLLLAVLLWRHKRQRK